MDYEMLQDIVKIVKMLDNNDTMVENLRKCIGKHYDMPSDYWYSYHDLFQIIYSNFHEKVLMNFSDLCQFFENAASDKTWYVGYHHRTSASFSMPNTALPEYSYWRAMLTSYCSFIKFQSVSAFPFPLK